MLKTIFIVLITSFLALNIAACGKSKEDTEKESKQKMLKNSNW